MKEENTKLFNLVNMNDADISTEEKPIIGTQALATCFGILLYERKKKQALVAHASTTYLPAVMKLFELIDLNSDNTFEYLIIPGYYSAQEDHYDIQSQLLKIFNKGEILKTKFIPFTEQKKFEDIVQLDKKTLSYEFAFDSRTGKFVNNDVYFGIEYLEYKEKAK